MKKLVLVLVALTLGVMGFVLSGRAEEEKEIRELMLKKLKNSQKVLEGLALNDFDLIANHGEELVQISKATEWKVVKTPQYELFSNDFRRSAQALVQKARDKNLDGATLAYMDMTMNCVKCHKYVREVRMARRD